jgi:hypothetical protein
MRVSATEGRGEFRVLSLATFLCFTTVSKTALLAVGDERHDMPLAEIGGVLSVYGAAVIVFTPAGAPVARRQSHVGTRRPSPVIAGLGYRGLLDMLLTASLLAARQGEPGLAPGIGDGPRR